MLFQQKNFRVDDCPVESLSIICLLLGFVTESGLHEVVNLLFDRVYRVIKLFKAATTQLAVLLLPNFVSVFFFRIRRVFSLPLEGPPLLGGFLLFFDW